MFRLSDSIGGAEARRTPAVTGRTRGYVLGACGRKGPVGELRFGPRHRHAGVHKETRNRLRGL